LGAVKVFLMNRQLGMGHARALLSLSAEKQILLATKVADEGLSVRVTEALVKKVQKASEENEKATEQVKEKVFDRDALRLQEAISDFLGF
jgi:ParB family chromosome partitioning protein